MRAMKDSGVEWIGELPADWDVIKNKYLLLNIYSGGTPKATNNDFYCEDNGVPFVSISDMSNVQYVYTTKKYLTEQGIEDKNLKILPKETILYSIYATIGAISELKVEATISQAILALNVNEKINKNFYKYNLISMKDYVHNETNGNTQFNLNAEKVRNFYFVFPPLHEQQRIADYLDKKCAEIDAIISKQHSIIEKLQEYKLSLITETVTKGLNADAEMKDSGIEWIGEFPKHWDLIKIGIVCKTSSGATPSRKQDSDFYVDNANIPWIKTLDLNDGLVYDSSEKISEIALENSSCTIMPMNTVCVAMYGGAGTIGKCGLLKIRASTNQAVCSLECSNKIIPLFLLFQILTLRKYWMKYAVGTRKDPNISQDIVNRMKIVLPPIMEQEEIAKFINLKSQQIDELIQRKQYLIDKLTEYKKSLIYEVVTGKKEV